jgi:catalase (peroxidase I)
VSVLRSAMNRYVSRKFPRRPIFRILPTSVLAVADSIAMGLIFAVESCGGPTIAFRGGRLDAGEPNSPGVPEPQQDLDAHISAFARQGFTQTEMISLIACGYVLS